MKTAPDRIELMQTFVRIVEAGSLSAAAAQMGATQPTVSRRLQALERSLGIKLLQRSTHAMQLTEDGARCFDRAKELLGRWEAFESDLRGSHDLPEGTLRVMAPHAFGQQQLIAPLAQYLRQYPRVAVEWLLHDGTPNFISDGIDCAIHVGTVEDPAVVAVKMAEIPRIVVAAPALLGDGPLPRHASQLAALPWLALRTFYRNDITLQHSGGEQLRLPLQPRISTDSLFAMRNAALMGLGVCVASAWAVADDVRAGRLLHLLPDWHAAPLPMYLLYPYAQFYPAKLRRFAEVLRADLLQGLDRVAEAA
ncbi:DNA-binding transcriptional LysR family regulator [Rhodoferax ferrireducens]|uniref:DNA-binding transcriptional LysR family regulator n=1 Tax=Rhodoferax ferrireducens TaxID=192843 RepID=A0ABU2CC78_9BURK|nr:LysR family transcriptional regulator [Rhodoferax ferrireducens]MDR7378942.1 DNA-binding transcriptional LysR family regulator [Rhodoferax ferrireducens]